MVHSNGVFRRLGGRSRTKTLERYPPNLESVHCHLNHFFFPITGDQEKLRLSAAKKVWKGLLSPRLELGISRVSGGRINQLSHESAFSFKSAA